MSARTAPINPKMLQWVREQAGFTRHELVERAKLSVADDDESIDAVIGEWESGQRQPKLAQLEKIAKTVRRPLITFFLATPPKPDNALVDFRTHVGENPRYDSPEFSALKRKLLVLQRQLSEIVREENPPLNFIGSMENTRRISDIVGKMRDVLGIAHDNQRSIHDKDAFQKLLRSRMEHAGIFVLFEGDLGSYHSKISPFEFRGIAISDPYAPMVVVNNNDAKSARSFTLLHELSHLLIGESGISGGEYCEAQQRDSATERLCNAAAAEFLVPRDMLIHEYANRAITLDMIDDLAETFMVSGIVVAIQLLNSNRISGPAMRTFIHELNKRWEEYKSRVKKSDRYANRNNMDKNRLGRYTIDTVLDAAFSNRITLHRASTLLGIPTDRFNKVR